MGRRKVSLMRIASDSSRRTTFRKRRNGLMKKAQELATLCDVKACVVVYPEGSTAVAPEVWPSAAEAREVFERFKAMPELEQFKKRMDQEGLLQQRIDKLQEQLQRSQRANRERETKLLLHDVIVGRRVVGDLNVEEVTSLGWMVDARIRSVNERMKQLRGQAEQPPAEPQPPSAPAPPAMAMASSSLPPVPSNGVNDVDANALALDQSSPELSDDWMMDMDMDMDMATPTVGGDLSAVVYSGFSGDNGAGTSASGSAWDDIVLPSDLELDADFALPDFGNSFPPM